MRIDISSVNMSQNKTKWKSKFLPFLSVHFLGARSCRTYAMSGLLSHSCVMPDLPTMSDLSCLCINQVRPTQPRVYYKKITTLFKNSYNILFSHNDIDIDNRHRYILHFMNIVRNICFYMYYCFLWCSCIQIYSGTIKVWAKFLQLLCGLVTS